MKFLKSLSIIAVFMALLSSCGTHTASTPYKTASALEIHMSDLQYLGESQISCEYNTYLGFIRSISKVNDKEYIPGNDVKLSIPTGGLLKFSNKGLDLASVKVLEDFPEATYFQIVMETKETDVMFLGSTTVCKAKVRAYKFK